MGKAWIADKDLEDVLLCFSVNGKDAFVAEEVICHCIQHATEPLIHLHVK